MEIMFSKANLASSSSFVSSCKVTSRNNANFSFELVMSDNAKNKAVAAFGNFISNGINNDSFMSNLKMHCPIL